jgi:hypothetical protein
VRCSDGTFQAPPCIDSDDTAVITGRPTPVITTTSSDPTAASPISFTVTFDHTVYWFVGGDVAILSGDAYKVSDFTRLSGREYTFTVYPLQSGVVSVQVIGQSCQDRLKNYNYASNILTLTYNGGPPVITLTTTARLPTNDNIIPIVAKWSSNVTGFEPSDVVVSGAHVDTSSWSRDMAHPETFTFNVIADSTTGGTITVDVPAGVATSFTAYTPNIEAAETLSIVFDLVRPTLVLSSSIAQPTKEKFDVVATFSEEVIGFNYAFVDTVPSLGVNKVTPIVISGKVYGFSVIVSVPYSGDITLSAVATATDTAYNPSLASNDLVISFDNIAPTITITSDVGTLTGANPVPITIRFSEVLLTAPTLSQFVIDGCTAGNFTKVSSTVWKVELTPSASTLSISYPGSLVTDLAGNTNTESSPLSISWSPSQPSCAISSDTDSPSPSTIIAVTMLFTEAITDFTSSSPSITNGVIVSSSIVDVLSDHTKYSFNVIPTTNGSITVALPAGTVHDEAGNGNLVAVSLVMIHDAVPPSFTPSSSASEPTNVSPIPFTMTVSETLNTALSATSFTITGGTIVAGSFSVTGLVATFGVTPSTTSSVVVVSMAANIVNDLAGNGNVALSFTRTYDNIHPTAVFTSDAPYSQSPTLTARITFNEAIALFTSDLISISGASVVSGSLTLVSPLVYSFTLVTSATTYQAITLQLAANAVTDLAGNGNDASTAFNMAFDTVRPTCIISSNVGDPYPLSPVPMIATFSEAITSFTAGQLTITGGSVSNVGNRSTTEYTFDVTPSISTGSILLVAYLPSAATTDLAGNLLMSSNNFTILFDTSITNVVISSTKSSPSNVSPVPFVATFSKAVTGMSDSSIIVSGGTLSNFTAISGGRVYQWDMTPNDTYSIMTASIVAGAGTDLLGHTNIASSLFTFVYDTIAPTFTVAFPNGVRSSPVSVVLTWSKAVTGFTSTDLHLSPGGLNLFTAVSGSEYTFQVTLSSDATVTLSTPTNAVTDAAGNPSVALAQSFIFDATPPTVSLVPAYASPNNTVPVPFTATFSEPVYHFNSSSITVTNGIMTDFTVVSPTEYTFVINGTSLRSHMLISVVAGGAYDATLNPVALTTVQFISDREPPSFVIRSGYPDAYNVRAIPVSAVFSEAVIGFSSSALQVVGGVISSFTAFNTSLYTFTLTANTAWVDITITVADSQCSDTALNPCPGYVFHHLNDEVKPNVTLTPAVASPSFTVPIVYTATFSEAVSSFTSSSLQVSGATVANVNMVSSSRYTFELTPNSTLVQIQIVVAAGAVSDLATNTIERTVIYHEHDAIAPVLTVYPLSSSPSSLSSFSYIALFSKVVTQFNQSDVQMSGANVTSFTGASGCQAYTVVVSATSDASITLDVPATSAYDHALNPNAAISQLSITRDATPPSVTVVPSVAITNVSPVIFTATFSEPVYGLTMSDVQAWNGIVDSFTVVSDTVCRFGVIPNITTKGVVQAGFLAGHVQDAAGNKNTFGQGNATYDISPSVVLTTSSPSRSSISPITYTATFNEAVTGLTESSIGAQVVGGVIVSSSLTAVSTSVYTFQVTPSSSWVMVAVQIPSSSVTDDVGNANAASNVVTIEHDTSLPTCTLSSPDSTPQSSTYVIVNITFSADVYGFNSTAITITGGTIVNDTFTAITLSTYSIAIAPSSSIQLVVITVGEGKALSVSGDRPAQGATLRIVHAILPSPTATDDAYAYNHASTSLTVAASLGVLANDVHTGSGSYTSATLVAVAATNQATTNGGSVSIATDGSFVYGPPSSFTVNDAFTYSVTYSIISPDSSAAALTATSSTATVTITV